MRTVGADGDAVRHARHVEVERVLRAACHLRRPVEARDRPA
jgi:hypothetical protein